MDTDLLRLPRSSLDALLAALRDQGYACVGPVVRDDAIVYRPLSDASDLPHGWHDHQAPGLYRLEHHDSARAFSWAVGPQALKPMSFAPRETLWRANRGDDGRIEFQQVEPETQPTAVIGVRACDLAALRLQDRHFMEGPYRDPYYASRREGLFLVAVHCSAPAQTCFCASTGDGPHASHGYDLAMYETDQGYLIQAGTGSGAAILAELELEPADSAEQRAAEDEVHAAAAAQTRALPDRSLRRELFDNLDHPQWVDVAGRCLSCGNCTAVCPTCFCHAESDAPTLDGKTSAHYREWGSCFTPQHSYVGGFVPRSDTRLRYRQWLTHKLGSWHDQYGRSGCVGCGRCITWCPVGIDLTDEAPKICTGATT
jgi:ferredoxin